MFRQIVCIPDTLLLAHYFLHVSRIRVKSLNLRLLMSYIYIYDISSLRVKEITNSCCLLGSYDLVILGVIRPLWNISKLIMHSWMVSCMWCPDMCLSYNESVRTKDTYQSSGKWLHEDGSEAMMRTPETSIVNIPLDNWLNSL